MTTEYLTEEQYRIIQMQLQARSGVEPATGEVKYLRYVASLSVPSTGAILRLTVDTARWVKMPGERQPYKVAGKTFRVEGSIHKAMHGHNVYGGPVEPQSAIWWMINQVSLLLECEMPSLEHWFIRRLDVAESFDLGHLDNVRGWIRAKSLVVYPRREVHFWGDMGFAANGTTTDLRAYAKGPQFHKEGGYKALLQCRDASVAFDVARIAERTLRCEVEIKQATFEKLEHKGRADMITREWLHEEMYDKEWRKFLRPIDSDSRMVHTAVEVAYRLQATYLDSWLNLYIIWCVLAVRGEGWYRTQVAASTWRHQRAKLESAGVSWESTNILTIDAPTCIQHFGPFLGAIERITEVLPVAS
jgi:II/X family phage/plasmid replication protein